jgi:dolichol-phosphate mannosyltransferase
LPRETGDFKLLSRRAVDHLICLKEKKPFIRGLVCWIGFKQVFINYQREMRFSGKTKFPVFSRRVINNFLDSALISFSTFPLKLCLLAGMLVAGGSFFFLFYIVVQKFLFEYTTPGWSALMVSILFLGGIQLVSIGILGLYVSSIFLEVKGRPNYIIKDFFGFNLSKKEDKKS